MKGAKKITFLVSMLLSSIIVNAQVQVRNEPLHKPVLQNKYFRLLDVWLQPGDTTLFHIHSTPSLFVILSKTVTAWQEKGKDWVSDSSALGRTWYRSFAPDSLVHRVCNIDKVPFHVNDIELLSVYQIAADQSILPYEVVFDNEKATAYKLKSIKDRTQTISERGPMIAELVKGEGIAFHNEGNGETKELQQGKYLYIVPGTSFYFSGAENKDVELVLFEIK